MQRIQESWLKIKGFVDDTLAEWGMIALIVLAVLGAFGLGRLSALQAPKPLVEVSEAAAAATPRAMAPGGQYVASRTGEVYYFPWCAGAQKIAAQNQRWFATEEAARKAGYRPAKNCKGLAE